MDKIFRYKIFYTPFSKYRTERFAYMPNIAYLRRKFVDMDNIPNAVLIQGATLADIEAIVNRTVDQRIEAFFERIQKKPHTLIKRKEAASLLGKSLPTIDAYSKVGLLHKKHIGGMVYFDEQEVLSLKNR